MDLGIVAQQVFNGLMLGVIYSMIAVGFSLFFGCSTSSSSRTVTS